MSECPGSRPDWPYLCVRTAWCLSLSSFVFLLCLFSALVRTAGCLSLSPSFVLAKALHVGFFFFSFLVVHILLLLSSCVSSWKDCACRGKLSSSDRWHCLSVLMNLVGPPLAVVTLNKEQASELWLASKVPRFSFAPGWWESLRNLRQTKTSPLSVSKCGFCQTIYPTKQSQTRMHKKKKQNKITVLTVFFTLLVVNVFCPLLFFFLPDFWRCGGHTLPWNTGSVILLVHQFRARDNIFPKFDGKWPSDVQSVFIYRAYPQIKSANDGPTRVGGSVIWLFNINMPDFLLEPWNCLRKTRFKFLSNCWWSSYACFGMYCCKKLFLFLWGS